MAAPNISGSNRFIPEGTTDFYWVPTMASYLAPTRAELNAGTRLTPELAATGSWDITSSSVNTPDLSSGFVSQIPGTVAASNTTINMYSDVAGNDARSLMPRNATGFIVKFPGGDVTGRKMTVFPVKVGSASEAISFSNPVQIAFTYYVTKVPAENVTVP